MLSLKIVDVFKIDIIKILYKFSVFGDIVKIVM